MSNSDYSFRRIFELEACTSCRICADVCPAVKATGNGNLSGMYRLTQLRRILRSRTALWRRLFRFRDLAPSEWKDFSQTVFKCTLCGACQEVCPSGIHLKELWLQIRQDLNHSLYYPEKIDTIRENLDESHNVFGEDNEERSDWVEECQDEPEDRFCKNSADIVYFTGCVSSFYPLAQQIPVALADIFQLAGVDFTLLGEDEWCCGFPLLGAGLDELAGNFIDHNMMSVNQKGAGTVVFSCPSCYRMWQEHYPYQGKFSISHTTEFLLKLVKENSLKFKDSPLKVTYHDPCDLGRGAREFENARMLIKSIPGVELVEMENNRENCCCCGGGGNLEMIDPELSSKITEQKIKEITATGAQAVVTSCQQCVRTITTWVRRNEVPLQVYDITRFVRKALVQ
ncbi:MAG: (Fe-S)-binding protein [Deltaproteobacteria bacterium]|nr:(Fe-S)-binding protein [Deltaproteobacteria bacterium]